jgi:phosphoglycerate dehydrogenase-like enzyme
VKARLTVLVSTAGFAGTAELARALMPEAEVVSADLDPPPAALAAADVLVPLGAAVGGRLLAAAPRLRLVQQWGSGLDKVDVATATQAGVAVAAVPTDGSGAAESVAEWCVMAAIALSRGLPGRLLRGGDPGSWGWPAGRTLLGRTVGVAGLGGVGRKLVERLRPFDVRILGVTRRPSQAADLGLAWLGPLAALPELLARSEVLFVCMRLTAQTRGMLGAGELGRMPRGSLLVNAARAGLVDQGALEAALRRGHLGGAALDVFWEEPVPRGDPLLAMPNVLATPHVAGVTDRSWRSIGELVAANVRRLGTGARLLHCVNPQVLDEGGRLPR